VIDSQSLTAANVHKVLQVLGRLERIFPLITPLELRQRNSSHSVMVARNFLKKLGSVLNRLRSTFEESDTVPMFADLVIMVTMAREIGIKHVLREDWGVLAGGVRGDHID